LQSAYIGLKVFVFGVCAHPQEGLCRFVQPPAYAPLSASCSYRTLTPATHVGGSALQPTAGPLGWHLAPKPVTPTEKQMVSYPKFIFLSIGVLFPLWIRNATASKGFVRHDFSFCEPPPPPRGEYLITEKPAESCRHQKFLSGVNKRVPPFCTVSVLPQCVLRTAACTPTG